MNNFGGREQCSSGPVAIRGVSLFRRLHNIRHTNGMNFVSGLHRFLLQIKEDFGEPRPFLRQSKHRVIHYLQSKRGLHAFAMRICHSEMDARIVARLVDRGVGGRIDLEFIGRLHEHQAMIRDRTWRRVQTGRR